LACLVALALAIFGCKRLRSSDTQPLDQAGMGFSSIEQLRSLDVSDAEIAEVVKAHRAGISDTACLELVRLAHGRKRPFADGDDIAGLRQVGVSESTILELARLNQLGPWVGEAQAVRLAGFSDQILLAIARRRAAGRPTLSGASLGKLKNAGYSDAQILEAIRSGLTDAQAEQTVAARRRAAASAGFVRYHRRRR
jgi:hypothetical protein